MKALGFILLTHDIFELKLLGELLHPGLAMEAKVQSWPGNLIDLVNRHVGEPLEYDSETMSEGTLHSW